jgi:transcription initiation factor TFIIIB Brf1 subunit/transcription initiation factor TFIIB
MKPTKMNHPKRCPECRSDQVYYGRFSNYNEETDDWEGEYYCEDCGWLINAITGDKME